jgi:hypothetical protein
VLHDSVTFRYVPPAKRARYGVTVTSGQKTYLVQYPKPIRSQLSRPIVEKITVQVSFTKSLQQISPRAEMRSRASLAFALLCVLTAVVFVTAAGANYSEANDQVRLSTRYFPGLRIRGGGRTVFQPCVVENRAPTTAYRSIRVGM